MFLENKYCTSERLPLLYESGGIFFALFGALAEYIAGGETLTDCGDGVWVGIFLCVPHHFLIQFNTRLR